MQGQLPRVDAADLLRAYIQRNFGQHLTLDAMARAVHMNRNYLVGYFKRRTGFTPVDYLNTYRVECAMRALRDSDVKIIALCASCGFQSEVTFYRAFRRVTGLTPGDYRARSARKL